MIKIMDHPIFISLYLLPLFGSYNVKYHFLVHLCLSNFGQGGDLSLGGGNVMFARLESGSYIDVLRL